MLISLFLPFFLSSILSIHVLAIVINRQINAETEFPSLRKTPNGKDCTFSCPTTDIEGRTLLKSPFAVSYWGDPSYSIFDCVYGIPHTGVKPRTCTYYRETGSPALAPQSGAPGCPHEATACSPVNIPEFSAMEEDKIEEHPWVTSGKPLLWTKEVWDTFFHRDGN
ncbi:hypothetical protein BDN72DRAFT_844560 [Pluteus cervinus]|uniref:Uncharacterized protein n=1 Tax=Pluteus cervinus TaxID=181527 RepID=A0ACD3AKR3_9AGAR|nr:hypothetical protein BDN72DRAFT_844560 [Pluteus cervinus]